MKMMSRVLSPLLLGVGLIAVLLAYAAVAQDLPEQIYTPIQQDFLNYNTSRAIIQEAPTWNYLMAAGEYQPAAMTSDEHIVRATLSGRYEDRDRVSVTLYDLEFRGEYKLKNPNETETSIEWVFSFPAMLETLHDVQLLIDESEPDGVSYSTRDIRWVSQLAVSEEVHVVISYRAEGASSFSYSLPREQRVDIDLVASVNDLVGSESARDYLRPTSVQEFQSGEVFAWSYENLIADSDIQLTLPTDLSFAQRVAEQQDEFRAMSRLAPLLVIAFVAALAGTFKLQGVTLRSEVYLMSGLGLALFYPLFTFLSGLSSLGVAATLSFLAIFGLVIGFLGRMAGWHRVRWPVGLLLIVFLGLFSLGMLSPWRGLSLTSGGVLMAGHFMNIISSRPAQRARAAVQRGADYEEMDNAEHPSIKSEELAEAVAESVPVSQDLLEPLSDPDAHYCVFCGKELGAHFSFCHACGQSTEQVGLCPACSRLQYLPQDQDHVHCISCGHAIR